MRKNPITWKGVGYIPRGDTTSALELLTKRLDSTVGGYKKAYDEQRAVNTSNLIASLYDSNGANVEPPTNGNFDIGAVLQAKIAKDNADYNREKDIKVTQSTLDKNSAYTANNNAQAKGKELSNDIAKIYGARATEADIDYKKALAEKAKKGKDTELTKARIDLLKAQTAKAKKPSFQEQKYDDTLKSTLNQEMSKNLASHGKMIDIPMTDKERVKIGIANKIIPSKDDYIKQMTKEIKDYYNLVDDENVFTGMSWDTKKQKKKKAMSDDIKALQTDADMAYNAYIKARLNDPNSGIPATKKVRKEYTVSEIKDILEPNTINELIGIVAGINDVAKDKTLLELKALKKSLKAKKASDKEVKKMQKLSVDLLKLAEGDEDDYNNLVRILNGSKGGK